MEIFKLPAVLRLVSHPQGLLTSRTKSKLFVLALAFVFAGTAVSTPADAKGLLEILFGIHGQNVTQLSNSHAKGNLKLRHRAKLKHHLVAIKKRFAQSCSGFNQTIGGKLSTNGSNLCGGGSGGFAFVSVAAGGGTTIVNSGGGTVVVPSGSFVALSGTVGFSGTVTVPGGQSVTVGGFQTVGGSVNVPVSIAPLFSSGFGSGSALGSASSIGAGSAASNSSGFGNSLTHTATSGVGATSSGGSGKSIGAGLGLGAGVGISAGIK